MEFLDAEELVVDAELQDPEDVQVAIFGEIGIRQL